MPVRSKPYTLQPPLDIEALDEMLDILFQDTRNGNLDVDMDQLIGVLPVPSGGTGLSTVVQGDLLYGSATDVLSRLAKDANVTRSLTNTGTSNNPAWAQVALATGVSGDLPFANLAQGSALSVLGVTGNATADNASIAAGTDHQVLRRSGTAVAFGALNLAQAAAITGDLPDVNLTANVPLKDATNAFTGANSFATNPLDLLVGQLKFPATQNPSSDSNTMDDYEEGSWTPGLTFGGGNTGITYVVTEGRYQKKGNWVSFSCVVFLSSKGSSTGVAIITGLPFSVENANGAANGIATGLYGGFAVTVTDVFVSAIINTSTIRLDNSGAGGSVQLVDTDFTNNAISFFSGTYKTTN